MDSEELEVNNPARSGWLLHPEWVARFREEALVHVAEISQGLEKLPPHLGQSEDEEAGLAEHKAVRELYRHAHTIKGSAGMVGLEEIAEQARQLEELFGQALKELAEFNDLQREVVATRTARLRAALQKA